MISRVVLASKDVFFQVKRDIPSFTELYPFFPSLTDLTDPRVISFSFLSFFRDSFYDVLTKSSYHVIIDIFSLVQGRSRSGSKGEADARMGVGKVYGLMDRQNVQRLRSREEETFGHRPVIATNVPVKVCSVQII